jgi:hypothetical protein
VACWGSSARSDSEMRHCPSTTRDESFASWSCTTEPCRSDKSRACHGTGSLRAAGRNVVGLVAPDCFGRASTACSLANLTARRAGRLASCSPCGRRGPDSAWLAALHLDLQAVGVVLLRGEFGMQGPGTGGGSRPNVAGVLGRSFGPECLMNDSCLLIFG